MQLTPMQQRLRAELAQASFVYQTMHTPEEIELLADVFAEALPGEDTQAVERAFRLHYQRSKRFPTPCHIIELLPECRIRPAAVALPEKQGKRTPGYGAMLYEKLRQKHEASPEVAKIMDEVFRDAASSTDSGSQA